MKKLFFASIFLISLSHSGFSQEKAIFLDAYIGGPQLTPNLMNSLMGDTKAKGTGPFGGKADFLLNKRHSIGIDVNYLEIKISGTSPFYITTDNGRTYKEYREYKISKTRVYVRYAFHMIQKEKVDFYLHVGIGSSLWSHNKLQIEEYNEDTDMSVTFSINNNTPIAFRTGIGVRYYFLKNVGVHAEVGAGGALLYGGLTLKLPTSSTASGLKD